MEKKNEGYNKKKRSIRYEYEHEYYEVKYCVLYQMLCGSQQIRDSSQLWKSQLRDSNQISASYLLRACWCSKPSAAQKPPTSQNSLPRFISNLRISRDSLHYIDSNIIMSYALAIGGGCKGSCKFVTILNIFINWRKKGRWNLQTPFCIF